MPLVSSNVVGTLLVESEENLVEDRRTHRHQGSCQTTNILTYRLNSIKKKKTNEKKKGLPARGRVLLEHDLWS